MLRARLVSKAVRMLAPEVVMGIYTPEETDDFSVSSTAPVVESKVDLSIVSKLESAFEAREDEVNEYLQSINKIGQGCTFRDLLPGDAAKLAAKPDLVLSKLPAKVEIQSVEVVQ